MIKSIFTVNLLLLFITVSLVSATAQKMTAEDVINKHLDSIGSTANRSKVKNQLALGTAKYNVLRQENRGTSGKAVVASEGNKTIFGTNYASPTYPGEKYGFDGKKPKVSYTVPGARSSLGNFLFNRSDIIKEGLLGGTLTSAWSLSNVAEHKARLEFEGKSKINDKEVYVLSYQPKGGSDVSIKIFFDAQNFQHVRTQYQLVIAAQQGSNIDNSAGQRETRQTFIEDFSDFKKENDLMLPHTYRMQLSLYLPRGTTEYEWTYNLTDFYFNQQLDANSFDITI